MSEQTAQEPTMEEILASIRRIISEDDAPAETDAAAPEAAEAPAPAEPEVEAPAMAAEPVAEPEADEDVLELTDRYEEPAPAVEEDDSFDTIGDIQAMPRDPEPAEEPYMPTAFDPEPETLVSDRTAATAASAFAGLSASLMMPREGRSLEDLVKEMMKPMLREWLDQNLPAIVEAQVRAEVERIARRGAR